MHCITQYDKIKINKILHSNTIGDYLRRLKCVVLGLWGSCLLLSLCPVTTTTRGAHFTMKFFLGGLQTSSSSQWATFSHIFLLSLHEVQQQRKMRGTTASLLHGVVHHRGMRCSCEFSLDTRDTHSNRNNRGSKRTKEMVLLVWPVDI